MAVLVTGGAGYVGSHCVKLLLEHGHPVVVYDNLSGGHRAAVGDDAVLIRADLLDRPRLRRVFDEHEVEAVLHFAALLNVSESVSQPQRYYENNVLGTMNLIGEMMRSEVRRLVFSSSCSIYGTPAQLPITEDMPKHPISPYGRTKLIVEMALQDCAQSDGLGSIALRYFNAAGAARDGTLGEHRTPEYHLIPMVLQVPLEQRAEVSIFGTDYPTADGTAVRDYVHVEDLAEIHVQALSAVQIGRAEAYNVGTGRGTSVAEVIAAAQRVTGCAIPTGVGPRRPGDPPELYADVTQVRARLGWTPQITAIDEIIASAWNWHRNHPHGYEDYAI